MTWLIFTALKVFGELCLFLRATFTYSGIAEEYVKPQVAYNAYTVVIFPSVVIGKGARIIYPNMQ